MDVRIIEINSFKILKRKQWKLKYSRGRKYKNKFKSIREHVYNSRFRGMWVYYSIYVIYDIFNSLVNKHKP